MSQDLLRHNFATSAIIGLGANLKSEFGPPVAGLRHALKGLGCKDVVIQLVSQFYRTPCFPKGTGPDYVNAVAVIATNLTASDLLSRLHRIEADMGRERKIRWGQRVLDLDLLAYGEEISPDRATFMEWFDLSPDLQRLKAPKDLILPHPRLHERGFVLVPLAEIAPNWCHPVLGQSAAQMLAALDPEEIAQIQPLSTASKAPK